MTRSRSASMIGLAAVALLAGIVGLAVDARVLGLLAGVAAVAVAVLGLQHSTNQVRPTTTELRPTTTAVTTPGGTTPVTALAIADTDITDTALANGPPAPFDPTDSASGVLLDPLTGLFSHEFFLAAVETRVLAARRHLRPVAVVLLDVIDGTGPAARRRADPAAVATAIRHTLREADTACRLEDGRYGFVLEDTPEDGAIWTVERLRRKLSEHNPDQTRWAGVACYPAHAFSAHEVMAKAEAAFAAAREWAQDRIEVAAVE